MSLARGIQSALFHYLSCAPCTGYSYRKKRRKQAKRDRLEREREMQLRSPDEEEVYQHPDPSHTNPFWDEEIALGPGPPRKRTGKKKVERSGTALSESTTGSKRSLGSRPAGDSLEAMPHLAATMDSVRTSMESMGENWNRRRYQREDEELWGFGQPPDSRGGLVRQQSAAGSSAAVSGASRPGTAYSSAESYYIGRPPPVNDLHPPVVSMLAPTMAHSKWMLQPPPKAAIQMGKERPKTRSRSGSGASSARVSLHRQVSEKRLYERMQTLDEPVPALKPTAPDGLYKSSNNTSQDQQTATSASASELTLPLPAARPSIKERREARRARRATHQLTDSNSSSETVPHGTPEWKPVPAGARGSCSVRPNLSTVASEESGTVVASPSPCGQEVKENTNPSSVSTSPSLSPSATSPPTSSSTEAAHSVKTVRDDKTMRSPLTISDGSSLSILQDLVTPEALSGAKFARAPLLEARIRLPPADQAEELLLRANDWPVKDDKKRWSMDI